MIGFKTFSTLEELNRYLNNNSIRRERIISVTKKNKSNGYINEWWEVILFTILSYFTFKTGRSIK